MIKTYAFSGHRPNKLGGWNWDAPFNKKIREHYSAKLRTIMSIYRNDQLVFLCGMADGFDMYMADVVLELKKEFPKVLLVAAVPFKNQPVVWSEEVKERYTRILDRCDRVVYVDDLSQYRMPSVEVGDYHNVKYLNRNDYMVSVMDEGIVLWDGSSGGTCDFVKRASKYGKYIDVTKPRDI